MNPPTAESAVIDTSTLMLQSTFCTTVDAARSGQLRLPLIPGVVARLIQQMRDPDVPIDALVSELEKDPVLAARAVGMANSPFFSGARSIESVHEAVMTVGTDTLRTLVISCGIMGAFADMPGIQLHEFWAASNRTANIARKLSRLSGGAADAAFLAGLLRLSGHLILCQSFPWGARAMQSYPPVNDARMLEELEVRVFGVSHRVVGAAWLESMDFPSATVNGVRHYLDPAGADSARPTLVLALATALSEALGAGLGAEEARGRLEEPVLHSLGLETALGAKAFPALYRKLAETAGS